MPRPWYLQGLIGGLNAAIGYALGVTVSWLFRLLVGRRPRPAVRAHAWQAYFLLSPVCAVWLISESAHMQRQLRALQGLPPSLTWHTPMIALITVALWALLLLLARAVRLGASRLIRLLGRLLPRPAAVGLGLLLSSLAVLFCVQDLVFERGVVDIADRISKATDGGTKEGVTPPPRAWSPAVPARTSAGATWASRGATSPAPSSPASRSPTGPGGTPWIPSASTPARPPRRPSPTTRTPSPPRSTWP
ncbi:alpha/beta-hydrolase N-terminal domain-containing protein [Streptomyces sp. S399]|uniref:alpha/beta-hydrolase N-terminal domain-containing protein n=1 Tax=Streptomyces sp. S399 TaxID=3096009 RepID=UPI0039C15DA7